MHTLYLRLFFATVLAFSLVILPLPHVIYILRPPWILLLILYLQFFLPNHFNFIILLLLGLLLDTLSSTILGEHAFALSLVTWLANNQARRFNFFPMKQQMLLVGFFALLYAIFIFLLEAFLGYYTHLGTLIGGPLMSMTLWPWIRLLADEWLRNVN